ncbi:MAG: VOC family protein [Acidobacteriota bacterium]|nr:VOC family protein [Acidobacteriota bacterium]
MTLPAALSESKLVGFLPSLDLGRSGVFFEQTLGLQIIEESPFAIVFDAAGTMLRLTLVQAFEPQPFTVLGWQVASIEESVRSLSLRGVEFLRYPGMNDKHPLAIWTAPTGAQIAWFKDPDGNVLSLTQF